MIIDKLENLEKYVSLNTYFAQAVEFLSTTDLNAHPVGKEVLVDGKLIVNFSDSRPKTKAEAKVETHDKFIDIQIPLTATEQMGYTPRAELPEASYNAEKDITFYPGEAQSYFTVAPGMFAVFFPQDGHAPAIAENGLRKVIVKVAVC